jgi:hypothetical protein
VLANTSIASKNEKNKRILNLLCGKEMSTAGERFEK